MQRSNATADRVFVSEHMLHLLLVVFVLQAVTILCENGVLESQNANYFWFD
jgi:hypothetical protein